MGYFAYWDKAEKILGVPYFPNVSMGWDSSPRIVTINCWNEWTERSCLEPDAIHGMKYLEAVRDVFGPR
jgi:hypothetical protein